MVKTRFVPFLLILMILLGACSQPTPPTADVTAVPAPGETPQPVATETPTETPKQLLLVKDGAPEAAYAEVNAVGRGAVLVEADSLSGDQITADATQVVLFSAPDNLPTLIANNPNTQFVVFTDNGFPSAPNLHLVRSAEDQRYFMAGYVATQVEMDFRIGGLFDESEPNAKKHENAFRNGVNYFCGRCVSSYQPIKFFPVSTVLPAGAGDAEFLAAFDELNKSILKTVYIPKTAFGMTFLNELASRGLRIVTTDQVPSDMLPMVVATVGVDYEATLQTIWPQVLANTPTEPVSAQIKLYNADPSIFTEGRMRLVNETIKLLQDGWVVPLSVEP